MSAVKTFPQYIWVLGYEDRLACGSCQASDAAPVWVSVAMVLTVACAAPPSEVAADAGAGVWATRAAIGGGGRLEAAAATLDDRLVIIGGFDSGLEIVARVDAYDPAADAWTPLAPLPIAVTHANAVTAGGKLYVVGALVGVDFAASGASFVYDPTADAWTPVASMPAGLERGASGVAAAGTTIIVAGGSAGDVTLSSVLAYDTVADTWASLPPLPSPRSHPVAAVFDGVAVVAGGLSAIDGTGPLAETLALVGDAWVARAAMPTARGGCASGVLDGRLLCAGGETADAVVAATEAYDPVADAWTPLAAMLTPRAGTYGAVLADGLHIPGGARVLRYEPLAVHEVLSVSRWPSPP
jgi:hypothetical protein